LPDLLLLSFSSFSEFASEFSLEFSADFFAEFSAEFSSGFSSEAGVKPKGDMLLTPSLHLLCFQGLFLGYLLQR
jgi:hypothetical protein